jgi:hypothetical protein
MALPVSIQGNGVARSADVTADFQLKTQAEVLSLQHYIARFDQSTFQIVSTATVANATTTVLNLKNDETLKNIGISSIRAQIVDPAGGTALPSANTYLQLGHGPTYVSGGSTATAANTHAGSGVTPTITAYDSGPTVSGTFNELDRYYFTGDGDAVKYNKEGSIIVPLNNNFEIRLVSDHTSGTIYARTTFMLVS